MLGLCTPLNTESYFQEPSFYVNVHFSDDLSSSGLFCYPSICVRTMELFPVTSPGIDLPNFTMNFSFQAPGNRVFLPALPR